MNDQKREEKFFIEQSLEIAGIAATIKEQYDPPWPDAIIQHEGEEIGLEHTELFKSRNIQKLQKFANAVTQSTYECYQGPASSIYPTFEAGKTKEKPEDIGKKLAAFIAGASDGVHHNPVWKRERLPQIKQIRIQLYPRELNLTQSAWRPELHFPREDIVETLKTSISEKERNRKTSYSKQISKNWLLITVQPMQDSQFFHWSSVSFDKAIINTGFERIILCDLSFRQWFDIPPS